MVCKRMQMRNGVKKMLSANGEYTSNLNNFIFFLKCDGNGLCGGGIFPGYFYYFMDPLYTVCSPAVILSTCLVKTESPRRLKHV